MSGIFKAYDIRGVYPNEINADIAYAIGRAYITCDHTVFVYNYVCVYCAVIFRIVCNFICISYSCF